MASLDPAKLTPKSKISKDLLKLCNLVTAKRAKTVIDHILEHGAITTEELSDLYGYDHAPRAARDVRESGIPLKTHRVTSQKTGRSMGAYTFDDLSKIKQGRIGGRTAFPKAFKEALVKKYGRRDAITGQKMNDRYLQIDHRIPYEIAGDSQDLDPEEFMLLDASSNRSKSWSCEHCFNFLGDKKPDICKNCFWAYPDSYKHIAGKKIRRVDVTWSGDDEVNQYESLLKESKKHSLSVADFIKKQLSDK